MSAHWEPHAVLAKYCFLSWVLQLSFSGKQKDLRHRIQWDLSASLEASTDERQTDMLTTQLVSLHDRLTRLYCSTKQDVRFAVGTLV
jgi:hypothetical protein